MDFWSFRRNTYCKGCRWWQRFNNFYGCKKFGTYKLDDFDRLCGGKHKVLQAPQQQ